MKKKILLLFLLSLSLCIGCRLTSDEKDNSGNETEVTDTSPDDENGVNGSNLSEEKGIIGTSTFNDCKFSE